MAKTLQSQTIQAAFIELDTMRVTIIVRSTIVKRKQYKQRGFHVQSTPTLGSMKKIDKFLDFWEDCEKQVKYTDLLCSLPGCNGASIQLNLSFEFLRLFINVK